MSYRERMQEIMTRNFREKYNTIKKIDRRMARIDVLLERNLVKIKSLRRDERTQRKVAINAKRDELCQEQQRLRDAREFIENQNP